MTSDIYSLVNDRIISAMEQGIIPWRRPWVGRLPTNYDSGKEYRGINILTLGIAEMVHGYSSPFCMTFLQANKHGGHIKKGEKATYIVFSDKNVKEVEKEDGTKEPKTWHVVRSYPVFNFEQTENVPKKAGPALDPDRDLMEVCNSVLDRMPNPPDYRESGSKAYYMPKEDLVNLPPIGTFKTTEGYVATKWHEYGHADPFPGTGGNKELLNPMHKGLYRLHISRTYTAFYHIFPADKTVKILWLGPIGQAHNLYGRFKK